MTCEVIEQFIDALSVVFIIGVPSLLIGYLLGKRSKND